ncbi:MerR family transcriptional regulator [Kribbella sandramycini]|uniref:DNA-binding transcriptional MerR regulator n=1 Tax=Kribbella sandramycini TaxID=60450 RepID=A0A7Y4L3I5_9ACTN|nr:HEAT repeat domain-containing protein [Kribbella sandramycini]MBB6566584.1 DNA-binding transcriptional MerR regulator [Kribbella sandramycini]NOL42761.1 MerR family transcriptional regulator [Kribbella sandramycini]
MLIGEVARRSGVSARMLRHYDTLGLVRPTGRSDGGYREYSADDIRRIFHVESLRSLGLSLRQIARALEEESFEPAALVTDLIRRTQERITQQQELLDRLQAVDASAPADWQSVLRIVALLHGLNSPNPAHRQQAALTPTDDVDPNLLAAAVLAEPDPNVAGALRWALARTPDEALPALAQAMTTPNPETRRRAIVALIELNAPTPILTAALDDPDPEVRKHTALALGARQNPKAIPALIALILEGANDVEAADHLAHLAQTHAPQILTTLTPHLTPATPTPARLRLTQALIDLPPPLATPLLHHLSTDPDQAISLTATAYLNRMPEARG